MDLALLKETVERIADRNEEEFKLLAEANGVGFAASVATMVLARGLGLVLAMAKTEETRQAMMIGFSALVERTLADYRSSIEMHKAIDRAKGEADAD